MRGRRDAVSRLEETAEVAGIGEPPPDTDLDGRAYLPEITSPTLVLVARDDILTPLESSEELAAGIPGAVLQVLQYGAHAVSQVDPETFNKAVVSFLAY